MKSHAQLTWFYVSIKAKAAQRPLKKRNSIAILKIAHPIPSD